MAFPPLAMSQELIAIIGIGIALAGLQLTGLRSLHGRIDRLEGRMDRLEARIDRIEARLSHLEQRMSHLEGLLEGLREAITGRVAS